MPLMEPTVLAVTLDGQAITYLAALYTGTATVLIGGMVAVWRRNCILSDRLHEIGPASAIALTKAGAGLETSAHAMQTAEPLVKELTRGIARTDQQIRTLDAIVRTIGLQQQSEGRGTSHLGSG